MADIYKCDLCGEKECLTISQLPPGVVICVNCGFIYAVERRSMKEIAADWNDIVYPEKLYSANWPMPRARLYYVKEYLLSVGIVLNGRTVFDVGAGPGTFLEYCKAEGAKVVGLDPSQDNCTAMVKKDIPAMCATVQGVADDAGPNADVVSMLWTLENTGDCVAMMQFAHNHLTDRGVVVTATGSRILVPFKKPLSSYINRKLPADLHAFRFSRNTMRMLAMMVGLEEIHCNDYRDSDWLVQVFHPVPHGHRHNVQHDKAATVAQFFAQWEHFDKIAAGKWRESVAL